MSQTAVKSVSRFEADLLYILRFILRNDPLERGRALLAETKPAPKCLSKDAVTLIKDTLAKGCVAILAKSGGWRSERHLKNGQVSEGKLWQRHTVDELRLSFSSYVVRLLIWLTARDPARKQSRWPSPGDGDLTIGDSLFLYFTFSALYDTDAREPIRTKAIFARNGLCRLAFADVFAESKTKRLPDFSVWTTGTGAGVMEALQLELTKRWIAIEQGKSRIADWRQLQALGREQERVLGEFLTAVETAKRWDLARFLFPVLAELLSQKNRLESWSGGLQDLGMRLADRVNTLQAALTLPRVLRRLQQWEQQARLVGYFDDDYAAGQLYKSDWEKSCGDELYSRAESLLKQAEIL